MKHHCRTLLSTALLAGGLTASAQGLEGVIVENYYTISAADATFINGGAISTPITEGTKVYRIYVDMAPNYKLNTVFGSPIPQGGTVSPNPLDFHTTTSFWNDDNFGTEVPPQTSRLDERAAFDSYITIGVTGRSGGAVGCGSNTQQQGVLKTADTNGNLTLCSVYSGFPSGAGTPDGNIPASPSIPALTYNIGGLVDLTALQTGGNTLSMVNDSWATLPNGTGVDPTNTNRVLIAQLTTDGELSFHVNVQLQAPGGALETYVWNQAGSGEQAKTFLTYPVPVTGCSSSQTAYLNPQGVGNTTTSLLTVGDAVGGYQMVGIPDGLGAFDNGNGTFTLLMNHELGNTVGAVRAHGAIGAFVSKWVFDKSTLCAVSGSDLMQTVKLWNGSAFVNSPGTQFTRFCSGDLPAVSAFYNAGTGKGTQERIYMNGEESGNEGRAVGHIVTGPNAGTSYQLPWLGRFSWENALACPAASDKTIVAGTDDTTPGQVYIYVGNKKTTGTEIDKAGLNNGILYGVKVAGLAGDLEVSASFPAPGTPFSLVSVGNVSNLTGAQLQANSVTAGITQFLRPEDASWDPSNPNDLYFVTTNAFTAPSRMWKLHFTDILNPELGGTITAVLDGTEGQKMMDNITVDQQGHVLIQEDVGNNAHIGRILKYDINSDALSTVAYHDSTRFLSGGANFLTQDEEASGIIDMKDILGKGKFLLDVQAHYATNATLVEGGQLLQLSSSDTLAACVPPTIASITGAQAICGMDTLRLNAVATGTPNISYSWSGTGNFLFGSNNASALVTGAVTGTYTVTATNSCGSASANVAVTVTAPASATISYSGSPYCSGTGTASVTLTGSTGGSFSSTSGLSINATTGDVDLAASTAGTYTVTYTIAAGGGCPAFSTTASVVINASTSNTTTASACDTYTWSVNGQTYTASGTYTDVNGCNTGILDLTITPSTSNTTTASACDSYTWAVNGQTYTTSGTYTSVTGCHTEILVLTITGVSSTNTTTASACDSYTWAVNGQTYTTSGTYTSVTGCNTEILNLTITPSTSNTTTASACDTYTWSVNGQTYTTSGTYTSVTGCHTEILSLTITPSNTFTTSIGACDSFTWSVNGQTYTSSGTYTSVSGCVTQVLNLTITPSTSNTTTASACGTYTWSVNGQTYTSSGTYTNVTGCHTEILVLTITIPGTACDDGNPNTINDALDASCVCVGTPVGGCTQNEVSLVLNTDANGAQTSWDIVNGGTTTVVCSGNGYASNSTITVSCCLADGCYDLQVFDSNGDGINPGGFVLTDANGKRIIDNAGNGAAFTALSKVAVSFCVPLGGSALQANSCDLETANLTTLLQAMPEPAVTATYSASNSTSGYQFWVFNPNGGFSRRIFFSHAAPSSGAPSSPANLRSTYFKLSTMSSAPAIPQNVLLNVRVRSRVNGVYGEFGAACRLKLAQPACQTTQFTTTADPIVSCGATNVNRNGGVLWAINVPGANKYQFEFVNANTNTLLRRIASATRNLNLTTWGNAVARPACGVPYIVRVRVSFDGGTTYCPFGADCIVTFTGCTPALALNNGSSVSDAASELRLWPNPNNGEQLNLNIEQLTDVNGLATLEIHNLIGERLLATALQVNDGRINTTVQLGDAFAPGLYMVNVIAGEHTFTQRLIIQ